MNNRLDDSPVPPSYPPEVTPLVARILSVIEATLGHPPGELDARARPALEQCLRDHLAAVEDRLVRADRLAHVGTVCTGVAHELRNPLAVIETSAFILNESLHENPRARRHLQRISQQLQVATRIVNDLLDIARAPMGVLAPTDVAAVIRCAVAQVPRAPEVALTLDLPSELPRVHGNAGRLCQVFVNLLTNAFGAMPSGGAVRVTAGAANGWIIATVQDNGPGIPPEILPRLFSPLVTARDQGVGLGLTLSRRMVDAHGGTLTAANAPTGGAVFTLSLPVLRSSEPSPVAAPKP